jgi:hypothetical protein
MIKLSELNYIDKNHLDIINKIYYTFLSNIKLIIINNKYIRETGFEHFENEWKNYKVDISVVIEDLVSKPFLLIPFNLEDTIEGKIIKCYNYISYIDYPKILKIQKTDLDIFKSNLINFMTLFDLRQNIYREASLIKDSFPLKLSGFELEVDQTYNLMSKYMNSNLDIGLEMYNCKLKSTFSSVFLNYIMIVYQNYLYFAQPDLKDSSFSLVKYKYALRHLEAQIDRSDPRVLNLIVVDKGKYVEIALSFEDVGKTSQIKKILEEHRKSSRNTEYLLLDSYFDDLISKWKF